MSCRLCPVSITWHRRISFYPGLDQAARICSKWLANLYYCDIRHNRLWWEHRSGSNTPITLWDNISMKFHKSLRFFLLLGVALTALAVSVVGTPQETDAASGNIYWGAHLHGKPPEAIAFQPGGIVSNFESNVSRKGMSIIAWGAPWEYPTGTMLRFQRSYFDNVRNHGSIPMLDWGSFACCGPNQPKYKLSNIARGDFDAFIVQWALDAKAWGHPFFLRFNWEMNGNWQFPWSVQLNGNTPQDYLSAWWRVRNIFTNVGANNVTWVWSPNISTWNTVPMSKVYPGPAFVDWIALDGYNWAGFQQMPWMSFGQVFSGDTKLVSNSKNSYAEITALAPGKPLMISEFATVEAGNDNGAAKARWITDAYTNAIINRYPAIKAVVWFNWADGGMSWPLDSSYAARQAFASAISSSTYLANVFRNLGSGKIPARR